MHDCNGQEIKDGDILISISGMETIKITKIDKTYTEPFAWFRGLNETPGMNPGITTQFAIVATRRVRANTSLPDDKIAYTPRTDVLYPDELPLRDELDPKDQLRLMDAWNEVDYFLKTMIEAKS